MKNEFRMMINKMIKGSFYILILILKDNKKVMAEEEAKVVAITTEDVEEDVEEDDITVELTGDKQVIGRKGEMHPELFASAVIKQGITSMTVLNEYLSCRKHRKLRMTAHMRLKI